MKFVTRPWTWCIVWAVLLVAPAVYCAGDETPGDGTTEVRVRAQRESVIVVVVTVRNNSTSPILVPVCGDLEGVRYLCFLAAHLQISDTGGWKTPEAGCDAGALPGGMVPERGVSLEPGKSQLFMYQVAEKFYRLPAARQLRLVIDVWPDLQSMKEGRKPKSLVTVPFVP